MTAAAYATAAADSLHWLELGAPLFFCFIFFPPQQVYIQCAAAARYSRGPLIHFLFFLFLWLLTTGHTVATAFV